MNWKRNPASNWKLYCIIDKDTVKNKSFQNIAERLFNAEIKIVQLRYKNCPSYELLHIAKGIKRLAKKSKSIFLINDRVDVAKACGLDGVHLGSGDLPLKTVRRILGMKSIVGKTVHNVKEAKYINRQKIDYVSAGPIFSTPLKKNLKKQGLNFIKKMKKYVSMPLFAIGGINKRNAKAVLRSGADGICVARAIFEARGLLKEIEK